MKRRLSITNHDRDIADRTYVYPVVSRRAGGVSVGVNLNPNNACNWRCAYCQVPDLVRGAAPPIDRALLRTELSSMLEEVQTPAWLEAHAPEGARTLVDVAISGNGEPTTCTNLDEITEDILTVIAAQLPDTEINKVIISNGSLVDRPQVLRALDLWSAAGGELWFKVDAGDPSLRQRLNGTSQSNERTISLLVTASERVKTRIQTCVVSWDDVPPSADETRAYLDLLRGAQAAGAVIHDVLLYGMARASHQPEADRIAHPGADWMRAHATTLTESLGVPVHVHA